MTSDEPLTHDHLNLFSDAVGAAISKMDSEMEAKRKGGKRLPCSYIFSIYRDARINAGMPISPPMGTHDSFSYKVEAIFIDRSIPYLKAFFEDVLTNWQFIKSNLLNDGYHEAYDLDASEPSFECITYNFKRIEDFISKQS